MTPRHGRRRRGTRVAPGAVAVATALGIAAAGIAAPAPVAAATPVATTPVAPGEAEGLWYYDVPGFADIHASGARGQGITIAVLDSPVNPDVPELTGVDLRVAESTCLDASGTPIPSASADPGAEHGTHMVSLIAGTGQGHDDRPGVRGVAPDASVLAIPVLPLRGEECSNEDAVGAGIDAAVDAGADIISMSIGGGWEPTKLDAVLRALRAGVVLVAAGADDERRIYPGVFNGVVTVEGSDGTGAPRQGAGLEPDVLAPGVDILRRQPGADASWTTYAPTTGSSQATAWLSGALATVWSAHPEATGNQIVQTLLRHTAGSDGEIPALDLDRGFGAVNVSQMLAADPTAYPDANPVLLPDNPFGPEPAEVLGEATPSPSPDEPRESPSGDTDGAAEQDEGTAGPSSPLPLVLGLGAVALAVIGAVLAVVLLRRSRSGAGGTHPANERNIG